MTTVIVASITTIGDHFFPTGQVLPYSATAFDFGPSFVKRPDVTP